MCQPSPRPLSTAVASTGKQENVYCCPSWRPISIAVFRSPPPFRLLVSAEGVQYSSRTMETSTTIPRPDVVIQPDYSSHPRLHFLLALPPCRYGDNQINSLRILKTLSLAPEPPSHRVVRLPIRRSRVLSSTPLGHSVIFYPFEARRVCGVVSTFLYFPPVFPCCLSCAPRQRYINRSRSLSAALL